jgi:methyltransferase family protein
VTPQGRFQHLRTRSRQAATYAVRAGLAISANPRDGLERTTERVVEWFDVRRSEWSYTPTDGLDRRLHELIGVGEVCEADGFDEVWDLALGDLRARGFAVGRGAFGGWDDADARLCRLAWCLTRHLRPDFVVETGVARGMTTRVILEAMERNGCGRLWSIDVPPLLAEELSEETAAAVPTRLRGRWTLLVGSSRQMLTGLLRGLPRLDVFVHDSMHTTRNVSFELDRVWPLLRPGGVMLLDDVERNHATADFLHEHPGVPYAIGAAEDGQALVGFVIKPGA